MSQSAFAAELLIEIEAFLKETGMGVYYIGWAASNNPHVVERLRNGGDVESRTAERLRAFMERRRSLVERETAQKPSHAGS